MYHSKIDSGMQFYIVKHIHLTTARANNLDDNYIH